MHALRLALITSFLAAAAIPGQAADALIGPDAWRELSTGKTLYYFKDGELYGKEHYLDDEGNVVFQFPEGQCAEGKWAYAEDKYCFAFGGQLHCFWHVMRDGKIVVIGEADGEEQTVEKIVDSEVLGCGSEI
jgi:hypothetical protein